MCPSMAKTQGGTLFLAPVCQGSGELIALSSGELIRSFGRGELGGFHLGEWSLQLG